jgi:transcriptional regulator with XRE-family HTH domain
MLNFGKRLKNLRQTKGLTQKSLAEAIGASERGIQNYELDLRTPTGDVLIALADHFNVSIDYLLGKTDSPEKPTAPILHIMRNGEVIASKPFTLDINLIEESGIDPANVTRILVECGEGEKKICLSFPHGTAPSVLSETIADIIKKTSGNEPDK